MLQILWVIDETSKKDPVMLCPVIKDPVSAQFISLVGRKGYSVC